MGGCLSSETSKPKVLVLGASGYIGKATLSNLVSQHGEAVEISAGVRDPEKFGTMEGVTVIKADMGGEKAALSTILKDYDRLYLVTPGHEDRTTLTINGVDAAKEAGVDYTLVVSFLTVENTDSIFGGQGAPIEEAIKNAGLKSYGILRLPLFMDNMYASAQSIKDESTFYDPRDPTQAFTPIAVNDVGKASAEILANPTKHKNKLYKLVMPGFTLNQLAEAFTKTLKKDVSVTTVPYEAAKESFMGMGFPEWQVDGIMELFQMIDNASEVTNETKDTGDFETITGTKPMTMEEWVEANAAGFQSSE